MSREIVVVHNQRSGSALSAKQLEALFVDAGFAVAKMIAIGDSLKQDLDPFVKNGHWIAAVGGDGTISAVTGIVAGTKAVLVPLPGGTLNNFTKDLGIDQDLERAIAKANGGVPESIDVASVNDRYFVNNSSIGVYPYSLKVRERTERSFGKWPAALYGISKAIVRFRTYKVTLARQTIVTPFVFVGNNDYKLDTDMIDGRTKLTGGELSVYAVRTARRWGLVRLFAAALTGSLDATKELVVYHATELTIATRKHRQLHVSRDGEVMTLSPPLLYKLHAGALTVVAPRSPS